MILRERRFLLHLENLKYRILQHVFSLVKNTPPLDLNSEYHYMIQCSYFRNHCIIAQSNNQIAGFISGYIHPERNDTLFIWQVAVDKNFRGRGLPLQ
jgi:L-2,4-diaminobutyric acid acetyltransferase